MTRGTQVNPQRVKPYIVNDAYCSRMLIDSTNSQSENMQVNYGVLKAGKNLLPPSAHMDYDETYIIVKGSCRLMLDGRELTVAENDVIFIPKGVPHGLDNTEGKMDVELFAILPFTPQKGQSGVYDARIAAWGKSFVTQE